VIAHAKTSTLLSSDLRYPGGKFAAFKAGNATYKGWFQVEHADETTLEEEQFQSFMIYQREWR